jgi:hypothetical protein
MKIYQRSRLPSTSIFLNWEMLQDFCGNSNTLFHNSVCTNNLVWRFLMFFDQLTNLSTSLNIRLELIPNSITRIPDISIIPDRSVLNLIVSVSFFVCCVVVWFLVHVCSVAYSTHLVNIYLRFFRFNFHSSAG